MFSMAWLSIRWAAFIKLIKMIPVRTWLIITILVAAYFGISSIISKYTDQIEQLTSANEQLTAEVKQLKDDVNNCVSANVSNITVIGQLRNDKKNAEDAVKIMEARSKVDKQNMKKIKDAINAAPESDNGKVSPILKNTVKSIIDNRKSKEIEQ